MGKQDITQSNSNAISEVVGVHLGDYMQKILVEGRSEELPVVIVLHGGPGFPVPFCTGSRGLFPEFTDRFILICWDQYGCGLNRGKLRDNTRIRDYVEMTVGLIDYVKKRFPENKLYLVGLSFGSVLAAYAANERADFLDGVVTYGQVVDEMLHAEDTIRAVSGSGAPKKLKEEATRAASAGSIPGKTIIKINECVTKFSDGYANAQDRAEMKKRLGQLMKSPDYRLGDYMALTKNDYDNNESLWKDLGEVSLETEFERVRIPYRILEGEQDIMTPVKKVRKLVERISKRNLTYTTVRGAAHYPGTNAMNAILTEVTNLSRGIMPGELDP